MKVYLRSNRTNVNAIAEYNLDTKQCIVVKGSRLSEKIAESRTFRGRNTIEKLRDGRVKDNILLEDICFNSPSTAANFVTGSSTNGMIAWKTEDGVPLKKL